MLSRISLLAIAALPSAMAAVQYAEFLPQSLATKVAQDECILPDDFKIYDFGAKSFDGGVNLTSVSFTFVDVGETDELSTDCHYEDPSDAVPFPGRSDRFICDNENVSFLLQGGVLTLVEEVCPGENGAEVFEASGSVTLSLTCEYSPPYDAEPAPCSLSGMTELTGKFSSINPVPPPPPPPSTTTSP